MIKGFAVFLMLFHHLLAFPDRVPEGAFTDGIWLESLTTLSGYAKICVPVFFFVSGYGFSILSERRKYTSISRLKVFYSSYMFYFLLWASVGFFVFSSTSVYPGTEDIVFKYDVYNLFMGFWGLDSTYNREAWFAEIYIYLIFLFPVIRSWKLPFLLIVSAVGFLFSFYLMKQNPTLAVDDLLYWQPSFIFGVVLYKVRHTINIQKLQSSSFLSVLVFWIINTGCFMIWCFLGKNILNFITPVVVLSLCLVLEKGFLTQIFSKFGKVSLPMWLIHPFLCYYFFDDFIYGLGGVVQSFFVLVSFTFVLSLVFEFIRKKSLVYFSFERRVL
ncbi:acyltransferase [Amphritea japonica]|uniref:acyltransferase n=1 Tax=Amphritea japonica TaxID=452627 RepID=UPI0021C3CC83|nr:acyltransferase [Amphritea japonica]